MEWADLALSFTWGGCAGQGNVDAFSEFTMVASRAGEFEINFWTDLLFERAEVEKLWPCGDSLDGVLMRAATQHGGTLTQPQAEEIARAHAHRVFTTRDLVRERLKALEIAGKQGPRRKTR